MSQNDDKLLQFHAAKGLDELIGTFRKLGVDVMGATCVLSLGGGKVMAISGGGNKIIATTTTLVGLLGLVDLIESADLDDETRGIVADLKRTVSDYVSLLDSMLARDQQETSRLSLH